MIDRLKYRTYAVLPLVYDESLSYYEVLCKTTNKINEIIDVIESLSGRDTSYIDNAVTNLKNYVDSQDSATKDYAVQVKNETVQDVNNILNNYIIRLNQMQNEINGFKSELLRIEIKLRNEFEASQSRQDAYIDIVLKKFRDEINSIISEVTGNCWNPVTGRIDKTCDVIQSIYGTFRYDAFTCIEFDSVGFTVNEFENIHYTVQEFDIKGRKVINKKECECYIRNPFTGIIDSIQNVIGMVIGFGSNSYNCLELAGLMFDAETYDDRITSTYEFDFNSKELLTNSRKETYIYG